MSIPERLTHYLDEQGLHYQVHTHEHSHTSAESARMAHIMLQQLAKPVLLEDDNGCVMAVVPGDHTVRVSELARMLGRPRLHLSEEAQISTLFPDCERGAMPPVGMAWGVETIVDDALSAGDSIYLEGGDHETLLQLSADEFDTLASRARRGHFCHPPVH